MPTDQPARAVQKPSPRTTPAKAANKAQIAKAFDNKSPSVKERVRQWQQQGGGVKTASEFLAQEEPETTSERASDKATTEPPLLNDTDAGGEDTGEDGKTDNSKQAEDQEEPGEAENPPLKLPVITTPERALKVTVRPAAGKKRQVSAAKLRIAQAIVGPTIRPSERLRRLSEAKKEREARVAAAAAAAVAAAATPDQKSKDKEVQRDKPKESALPKQPGTPKKRIISDGHWRKTRALSEGQRSEDSIPRVRVPTIESWLNYLPSDVQSTELNEPSLATPGSDKNVDETARAEMQAKRQQRRERLQARRIACEEEKSSNDDGIRVFTTPQRSARESTILGSESELTSTVSDGQRRSVKARVRVKPTRRPKSAPNSIAPTRTEPESDTLHQLSAVEANSSYISASSSVSESEESDNLTSISRRPPPKRLPGQGKRTIFSHAAKIFTRQENRFDPQKAAPPKTDRVPIVESWLNHTPDPFVDETAKNKAVNPSASPLDLSEVRSTKTATSSGPSYSDRRTREVESSKTAEIHRETETKDTGPDGIGRKKRLRRVLHHRDGTVTLEDASLDDIQGTSPNKPNVRLSKHRNSRNTQLSPVPKSRRLANHSDLMTVLSNPQAKGSSIRSARSIRSNRSRLMNASIEDLLGDFAVDEANYMRELFTLVEGVIPVLLSSILSRTNAAVAAGLFNPNAIVEDKEAFSKPIFNMGLALERIKVHHTAFPKQGLDVLLKWVEEAVRPYMEYLKAWRMGFQDVVVNLAPREGLEDEPGLEKGLPRNAEGDVVDSNGERVDVAYLLKRPLVRLKYITKSLKGMQQKQTSVRCERAIDSFQSLVNEARRRSNEEQARLEDEAASALDTTKARDLRTLAPLESSFISRNKRVKARDSFDLVILHSTGQRMDCRVEMFLREDTADVEATSELLVAEVDGTGKWLLFPPIEASCVSARNGDQEGEIIVMIRGQSNEEVAWHELLSLTAEEEQTSFEWVQMLGLKPIPPAVPVYEMRSLISADTATADSDSVSYTLTTSSSLSSQERSSQISNEIQVPIGERFTGSIRRWQDSNNARARKRLSRNNPSTIFEETASALDADINALPHNANALAASPQPLSGAASKPSREERSFGQDDTRALNTKTSGADGLPSIPTQAKSKPTRYHARKVPGDISQPRSQSPKSPLANEYQTTPVNNLPARPSSSPSSKVGASRDTIVDKVSNPESRSLPSTPALPPSTSQNSNLSIPDLPYGARRLHRRTSSPLKHEYAPSSSSESEEDSDASTVVHDLSSASDSSDSEFADEAMNSIPVPMSAVRRYRKVPRMNPPDSSAEASLMPANSDPRAPLEAAQSAPTRPSHAIANISFWSDKGAWESLWPNQCSIMVSPGLIEAYEVPLNMDNTLASMDRIKHVEMNQNTPLIGLELTPLVPIRRGTALDISIRSPPTSESRIEMKGNNNFLFRSRSPEECEALYALINHSRINNPTYIALQNARAVYSSSQFHDYDRKASSKASRTSSWFGLGGRRNSYRASSNPAPSLSRNTESSVGSLSSAFSAFRNFGRGNSRFNLAKSTISSRYGSRSTSLYTSSDGTGSSGMSGGAGLLDQPVDGALGLNNCKIRLYIRESTSKWADLGSARLTIMRPNNALSSSSPGTAVPDGTSISMPIEHAGPEATTGHGFGMGGTGGYTNPGNKISANDKRILVTASPKGLAGITEQPKALLDVTLSETCFERVARTGIAVSVWENFGSGMIAKEGGVIGGRLRVYMMQFKNEADTAYTYGIVGKLRY